MRFVDRQADATDAVAALMHHETYSLCICHGQPATWVGVIHDEGQGGRMRQHVFHRRFVCANEAKTQVGRRREYERSPSSADVGELVPPPFAAPFSPFQDTGIVDLVFV